MMRVAAEAIKTVFSECINVSSHLLLPAYNDTLDTHAQERDIN